MAFTNFTQFIYIFLVLFCVVNALKEPTESAQNNIIQSSNYYVGNYYSGIDTSLNGLAFEVCFFSFIYLLLNMKIF